MKKGCAILACLVPLMLAAATSDEALKCDTVDSFVKPCLSFIKDRDGNPTKACCDGLSDLKKATPTIGDIKVACYCLVSAGQRKGVSFHWAANATAAACGLNLKIAVKNHEDCNSITY